MWNSKLFLVILAIVIGEMEPILITEINAKNISHEEIGHITDVYKGIENDLEIDADVEDVIYPVFTGTLSYKDISLEKGKKIYGDEDGWHSSDFIKEEGVIQYKEENIFLMVDKTNHSISFDNANTLSEIPKEEKLSSNSAFNMALKAISLLGLNAEIMGEFTMDTDPEGVYSYSLRGMIDEIPIAMMTSEASQGSIEITGNKYSYAHFRYNYIVDDRKEVTLLEFSKILEKVKMYVNAGYIEMPESGQPVCAISLEYFVENTKNGIIFYPIWNFQVPSIYGIPMLLGKDTDDYFYIDARDGMLVKCMI